MRKPLTLAAALLLAALLVAPAGAATCQVTPSGAGSQDGSSWANAAPLQAALGNASCTEIWVQAGVYKPTTGTDRTISFNVGEGVAVYGGFAGTETLRSQADPATHRTVLSGDIDGNDATDAHGVTLAAANIVGANSYHVVVMGGLGVSGNATIGASTVLDGLTITAGLANGGSQANRGSGLYCNGSGPGQSCSPSISHCTFSGNSSAASGGAIYNYGADGTSNPTISHSTFSGNSATSGGAIYTFGSGASTSRPTVERSIFWGNTAASGPQAVTNFNAFITFTDSLIQGGCASGGSGGGTCAGLLLTADPQLGPLQDNGGPTATLLPGANGGAVDAVACPASPGTDQRGVARPQGALCDLGAVELRPASALLSITVSGQGTVSGGLGACASTSSNCSASYPLPGESSPVGDPSPVGTSVPLQANAAAGYTFTGWGGQCSGTGACTVTMDQARSVTATFAALYPLTASASPPAGGTATCTASAANAGFTFTGFTGCDSSAGTTCTLSNVTGPRTVVALYGATTTFSGTTQPATGTGGPASVGFTGGGPTCRIDTAHTGFVAASTLPPGKQAPQGALRLRLVGCTPGATVRVTTTWPQPVADFTKRSQGAFLPASHFSISGNTVGFDITDGGLGDDDGLADGVITDPAMPLAALVDAQRIPTLSPWGVLLLAALLALAAFTKKRPLALDKQA